MDMATRSWSPSIQSLLVDLLNESNGEVRAAHQSTAGKDMKFGGLSGSVLDTQFEDGQRLAGIVEDPFDIGQSKEGPSREGLEAEDLCAAQRQDELGDRPKRERKAPSRLFEDPEYQSVYQDGKRKRDQSTDGSDSDVSEDDGSIYDSEFDDDAADSTKNDSEISSDFDVTGRNDVSNLELMEDENGEVMLHSRSQKQMREIFNRLSRKDQESFDQDTMVLRQLLSLSPDRIYTVEDLADSEILDRALRLLYRTRFGQSNDYCLDGGDGDLYGRSPWLLAAERWPMLCHLRRLPECRLFALLSTYFKHCSFLDWIGK